MQISKLKKLIEKINEVNATDKHLVVYLMDFGALAIEMKLSKN